MLLSDPNVAKLLSNEFVLCWESVGSPATVTVDFGNGRVLKRTLGGNTVMYICSPDGRVMDALPGIYTPNDFLSEARETLSAMMQNGLTSPQAWRAWHNNKVSAAIAAEQIRTTMSKRMVESPLLKALGLRGRDPQPRAESEKISNPHAAIDALAAKIEDLSKNPATTQRLLAELEGVRAGQHLTSEEIGRRVVALDSRTNVTLVRPAVHLLLTTYDDIPTPAQLRDPIFKKVLHVPIDDPYLGLVGPLIPGSPTP